MFRPEVAVARKIGEIEKRIVLHGEHRGRSEEKG
jgi:hypothetical protein